MRYKDYDARVEFDAEDEIFVGRLIGIADVIGFHAATVADLKQAFQAAVDDYLSHCAALGKSPERPSPGGMMVRRIVRYPRKPRIRRTIRRRELQSTN